MAGAAAAKKCRRFGEATTVDIGDCGERSKNELVGDPCFNGLCFVVQGQTIGKDRSRLTGDAHLTFTKAALRNAAKPLSFRT